MYKWNQTDICIPYKSSLYFIYLAFRDNVNGTLKLKRQTKMTASAVLTHGMTGEQNYDMKGWSCLSVVTSDHRY